jgi:hypothetical protein
MWHVWETLEVHVGLVGKPEGKRERERERLWHVWETLVVHVGLVGKPEGKRERELVGRMGGTGGGCREGGET